MHTFEQAIHIGDKDDILWSQRNARFILQPMLHLEARTKWGLKRKQRKVAKMFLKLTAPFPAYDYSQHAHTPVDSPYTLSHPGHAALKVARKRARVKLGLTRVENNLLAALDEADSRGWLDTI